MLCSGWRSRWGCDGQARSAEGHVMVPGCSSCVILFQHYLDWHVICWYGLPWYQYGSSWYSRLHSIMTLTNGQGKGRSLLLCVDVALWLIHLHNIMTLTNNKWAEVYKSWWSGLRTLCFSSVLHKFVKLLWNRSKWNNIKHLCNLWLMQNPFWICKFRASSKHISQLLKDLRAQLDVVFWCGILELKGNMLFLHFSTCRSVFSENCFLPKYQMPGCSCLLNHHFITVMAVVEIF